MKRLSYIIIVLVFLVGVFEWLSRSFASVWEPHLRTYLEMSVGKLTKKSIHIDGITLAFPKSVHLVNVRVTEPDVPDHPIFEASQIELSVSLLGLPRALYSRQATHALGGVTIHQPRLKLSKENLQFKNNSSNAAPSLPPWFTLAWDGGTLQWEDARAPHGQWTLYQSEGLYRILGPQTSLTVEGSIEEARRVELSWSRLGRRWSSDLAVSEGDTQTTRELIEFQLKHHILPSSWTVRGTYDFAAHAGGRSIPTKPEEWLSLLSKASLTFKGDSPAADPLAPSVGLRGSWTYKNRKITAPRLSFDSPWVQAQGHVELDLGSGSKWDGTQCHMTFPSGTLGHWHFQDALLQMTYSGGRWEFSDSSLRFLNGRIAAKGSIHNKTSDLLLTAENLSLGALQKEENPKFFDGLLNASCSLKGSNGDWLLSGAWWLTRGTWGNNVIGDAKGDLEITPRHFQAQGKSDQSHFRVSMAGQKSQEVFALEHLDVTLPSGATLGSEGRFATSTRKLQFNWHASQLSVPADLPFLRLGRVPLQGHLGVQGQLFGTPELPIVKATLQSSDMTFHDQPLGETSVTLLADKNGVNFPTFHIGKGFDGQYTNGIGKVQIRPSTLGKWSLSGGYLNFRTQPQRFEMTDMVVRTPKGELVAKGQANWAPQKNSSNRLTIEAQGRMKSNSPATLWDVPFNLDGFFTTGTDKREGQIQFKANVLGGQLQGKYEQAGTVEHPIDTLTAQLAHAHWNTFPFSTDLHASWSNEGLKPLTLKGSIATGGSFEFTGQLSPDMEAHGSLQVNALNLKPLGESLRFPKPMEGLAKGSLTLSGPLSQLKWSGHLEGGPVIYAAGTDHPFKVEQLVMDMTLASLEQDPSTARLTITEGQAKTAEELVRFHPGSYIDFSGDKPARLVLGMDLRNLHLGVFTLFGGLGMEGTWQIKPEGFAIQTRAQTRSLFINDYELEEGILQADYYNGELTFSAPPNSAPLIVGKVNFRHAPQLHFSDLFISGKNEQGLAITGDLGPSLWDFKMEGRGLDISTLGELSGFPYQISGGANLRVTGSGDSKHPHVEGSIELDRGRVLGLAFRTGHAVFVWQDDRITFQKLYLSDSGHYGLEGSGVFPIRPKGKRASTAAPLVPIDFSIRLRDANLSLLKSFSSEVLDAKGPVEGLLQIKGTIDDPQLQGNLRLTNGDITGAHYFRRLRNGVLSLEFEGNTIFIRELRGKSGEGEFRGSGKITLAGFLPATYDVQLAVVSSRGVEVQVPELAIPDSPLAKRFKFLTTESRCDVQGHVALRGPAESPTFSGEGIFSNGHFTFPPSHKKQSSVAILEWFRRIYWDVNLKFLEGAWFENELVQANIQGQMALKGPSDRLAVDGGVDISEGRISYLGLQFEIQQAHYDIRSEKSGDRVINTPYVRGVAESQIQAVDTVSGSTGGSRLSINDTVTLTLDYAPVDQIKPRLTSSVNPTMSQDKLLARVTQTDTENLTAQERNYLYQKQLVSLIDNSLTTPLAQNVLKKAGIADRLHVQHVFDANAVAGGDLNATASQQQSTTVNLFANTKYTIEKDLSNRLSLGYGVRFLPSAQVDPAIQQRKLDLISDVQLSYRWFRNVYLRGSFDLPTSSPGILPERKVTIEPRWRFGWWGNTNPEKKINSLRLPVFTPSQF